MSPLFSRHLDAVRFAAALVVLMSHFAYARFSGGGWEWVRALNLGSDAVVVFFVLSGLVIAHATTGKAGTLQDYLLSRGARLYSVAVPAVLLTLLLDGLGSRLNPAAYDGWWFAPAPAPAVLFEALTFSSQWGLHGARIGSNGPWWSLSYEVAYYLMFGAAVFLRGGRRVFWVAALALAAGPKPLLLLPIWLMGVWVHGRIAAGRLPSAPVARLLAWGAPVAYVLLLLAGTPEWLMAATVGLLGQDVVLQHLRFSDEFAWNTLIGALAAAHFLGVAALCRAAPVEKRPAGAGVVAWLAGGSFTLYLAHYPLLQFLDAVLPGAEAQPWRQAALLGITLLACYGLAEAFERRHKALRAWAASGLVRLRKDSRSLEAQAG